MSHLFDTAPVAHCHAQAIATGLMTMETVTHAHGNGGDSCNSNRRGGRGNHGSSPSRLGFGVDVF